MVQFPFGFHFEDALSQRGREIKLRFCPCCDVELDPASRRRIEQDGQHVRVCGDCSTAIRQADRLRSRIGEGRP